ncbi:hypothetical protein ABZP36_004773 [Zizania latifolia]
MRLSIDPDAYFMVALPACSPLGASNISWALCKIGDDLLYSLEMNGIAEVAITKVDEFNAQNATNVVGAFASMRQLAPAFYSALTQRAAQLVYTFKEQEIAQFLMLPASIANCFYDVFVDEDNVYTVMELCKGGELLDRILVRGGKHSEVGARVVMMQFLSVGSFCHLQGVVHRNLKPENFLFTSKDDNLALKVINFGLSDFVKPDERFNDIVGSAYYVAPEVLHRSYETEADMWSTGVIPYNLLGGSRPFWARTESGIFRAVLNAESSFDAAPWPTLTDEAKDFVKRLEIELLLLLLLLPGPTPNFPHFFCYRVPDFSPILSDSDLAMRNSAAAAPAGAGYYAAPGSSPGYTRIPTYPPPPPSSYPAAPPPPSSSYPGRFFSLEIQ